MMTVREAAHAIRATASGADVRFTGVTTDSRQLSPGDLFVALKGERYDAHAFVAEALGRGAAAAMVERGGTATDMPCLLVQDTRRALGELAQAWRARNSLLLIAITGSNGKTTVKEMLAAILKAHVGAGSEQAVLVTQGNLNNDIGVPLTLLRLREPHRYAVIEMGMNHPGEINYLSGLARPDVALINNAQRAHIGFLGGAEAVARAKGEIFAGLAADGVAVINADDPFAYIWRELAGARRRVEFALSQPAPVSARYVLQAFGSRLRIDTPLGELDAELQVPGAHNVHNALAACAAAVAVELSPASISAGLRAFAGIKGRIERKSGLRGALIIDDTYNANPDSAAAALEVLAAVQGDKIFVLGDMGELGPEAPALHADIGERAKNAGVQALFGLGELSAHAARKFGSGARHFNDVGALVKALKPLLKGGVTVLIKGSRFMQMERVVQACEAQNAA